MRSNNVVIIDEDGNETVLTPGVYHFSATMTVGAGTVDEPVDDEVINEGDLEDDLDKEGEDEGGDSDESISVEGKPEPTIVMLDPQDFISFADEWGGGSAYYRAQTHLTFKGATGSLRIARIGGKSSNTQKVFEIGDVYTLQADGKDIVEAVVTHASKYLSIEFPLTGLDEGWRIMGIKEVGTRLLPVYVMKGAEPEAQEWMPCVTSSHESYSLRKKGNAKHVVEWVPATFNPKPRPLPDRVFTPFSEPLAPNDLARTELVARTNTDVRRPSVTKDGVWTTFGVQRYTYNNSFRKIPRYQLLDGPRGVGAISGVYHMTIGKGRLHDEPDSPLMGNVYALDAWRLVRISKNGHITTLAGYRTIAPGRYHKDIGNEGVHEEDSLELVGDWSAIPPERHGMQGPWGFAVAPYSVTIDHLETPIPEEHNRLPHHIGPIFFIADTMNDRILRVEFDARKHDVPAKVTEFITGISNPFECVEWNEKLIVSERGNHRVAQYDMRTGAFERVILQGPGLSTLIQSSQRIVYDMKANPGESRKELTQRAVDEIRQHGTDSPEGLYVVGDLLYVASSTALNVVTVDLVTGERGIAVPELFRSAGVGTKYTKITVSDGTFGPAGAVFTTRWANRHPFYYAADGSPTKKWGSGKSLGYDTCMAMSDGRVVTAGAYEGIAEYRLKLPSDEAIDKVKFKRGEAVYYDRNYNLTYGHAGFSYHGVDVPLGTNEDLDYFLRISHSNNQN